MLEIYLEIRKHGKDFAIYIKHYNNSTNFSRIVC